MDSIAAADAHEISPSIRRADEQQSPPPRRSVQFSSDDVNPVDGNGPANSVDVGLNSKERRGANLFLKLRALTSSSIGQSPSERTTRIVGDESQNISPASPLSRPERSAFFSVGSAGDEESEQDADAEQSAGDESPSGSRKGRRKSNTRKASSGGFQTAPTTPRSPLARNGMLSSTSFLSHDRIRPSLGSRRATMNDASGESRQDTSDGEGPDRLARGSPWRRTGAWMNASRGISNVGGRKADSRVSGEERRPSNFRRFTGFGSTDSPESTSFAPWKLHRSEGSSSVSAARWRQLKAGIRMIGQRRKAENTVDYAKSAELLAELTAGVPAALILASMFQRDEHGNKRIPVLLEQLKVKVTDSRQVDSRGGDRHLTFRIELEYGSGLTRMNGQYIAHCEISPTFMLVTRCRSAHRNISS